MKPIIALIILCTVIAFAVSCNKSNSKKTQFSNSIIGTWELRQSSAAMNPIVGNYPAGNGKILKFTATEFEIYDGGQLVKKGQYVIVADATVETSVCLVFPPGQFANRVIYDGDTSGEKQFFQITDNRLSIVAGCYALDAGHRSDYERLSITN